ncbi:fumarylacetoacetate hydrolase family protein [Nocardioides albidus]|uniref:Fumarylacetoacetate hydrolase family protein n=1 Tax=Nocardioides albidus TaxID=1517589 RepID=A0A5C4VR73_9ACTN|nr:fumarylacetoacetate hydrolase family protein [Nocardioides albidus]TNM38348.1 fumarylacetoacetate hydrolase family protein [Nocardioides albidus]
MKFATYTDDSGATQAAVLQDGLLYPVAGAASVLDLIGDGLDALLAHGRGALEAATPVSVDEVRLEAPLRPPSMRDSMCFHEHIVNCMGTVDPLHSKFPAFYLSNHAAVIGPSDDAAISPGCEAFDYEMEVAAVVGRPGSNIRPEDARDHIVGYTMYIDWSARDLQMEEMEVRLGPAKGKDGATTIGPVLVSADELEPLRSGKGFDVAMSVAIDGQPISTGNWSTINWSFDDVVAYTSRGTHLQTGDVLGSGTVGKGCLFEQRALDPDGFRGWLREGEVVTFEVDLIGRMDIRVAAPQTRHPLSSGH